MQQSKVKMVSQELFKTRFYVFDLGLESFHHDWIVHIAQLRADSESGESARSVRFGWKADFKVFESPIFEALVARVNGCLQYVFKDQRVLHLPSYRLDGSVNITDPGGFNMQHGHSRCLFSGCYYLQVPEHSGGIAFHDPRAGAVYSPLRCDGPFGSDEQVLMPKAGQLVLFPSWLEHSVQPNESNATRISIPINAVAV